MALKPKNNGGQWRTIAALASVLLGVANGCNVSSSPPDTSFCDGFYIVHRGTIIQDIDSNDFPENIGRFAVSGFVYQRPEIRNLMS